MGQALVHCVFFRRDDAVADDDVKSLYADLARLVDALPGASAFAAGRNVSPEGFDQGYLDGFTVRFDDAGARDAYLVDETHKAIGARLVAMIKGGTDGLLVFDLPA